MSNIDGLDLAILQTADHQALRYSVMHISTILRIQLGLSNYKALVDCTLNMATDIIKQNAEELQLHPTELESYLNRVLEQMKENLNRNPLV